MVVDGTWSQAKKVVRENPLLSSLPRYAFQPPAPSEYRIRREPQENYVSTIEALPAIAAAVGDRATVLLDSGVRRGADIVKALALGAKAVMAGRPTLYGVAAAGQAGAERALELIENEYRLTMGYVGCRTPAEASPEIIASGAPV